MPYFGNGRDDLKWSWDGSLVRAHNSSMPPKKFYTLDGEPAKSPTENYAYSHAGKSPDGRYAAGDFAGEGDSIATVVYDAKTGKPVAKQPVQELLAWADNDSLIAWGCGPDQCGGGGEFRQQLLLVDVKGGEVRELTGFRDSRKQSGWTPYFSRR